MNQLILFIVVVIILNLTRKKSDFDESVKILIRQAARWSVAAEQDKNPFIANLHANYGSAYIFAVRDIASDVDIQRITGVDARKMQTHITAIQDNALKTLARICPEGQPKSRFLALIGGEAV